jgi:hypothetical protein
MESGQFGVGGHGGSRETVRLQPWNAGFAASFESQALRLERDSETRVVVFDWSVDGVRRLVERIGDDVAGYGHDLDGRAGDADRKGDNATAGHARGCSQKQKGAQETKRFGKQKQDLFLSPGRTV